MEKDGRKIKIIITILNILLSLTTLYFSYKEYLDYNSKLKNKDNLKSNFNTVVENKSILEKEIEEKNIELNKLNNIPELINEERNNVFKLASEVEHKIENNESDKKIVYLTFDDGPYYNTYKVLKILKDNDIKATFFTTNTNGNNCFDNYKYNCHLLYKEIASNYHTIANHTYTHGLNRGLYSSTNSFIDAVLKQEELIKSYTNITTNIVRFPGGSSSAGRLKNSIIEELRKHNYGWVDWTAEDGDGLYLSSYDQGWSKLKYSTTEKIEVVLFHDYSDISTQILPNYIKYLEDNNYIILPLFYDSIMINK